ncbi:MAG: HAMP domain-containing histidine kinase [Clostridia bacterium]|nr:HAMP domain-containing histidine kinase [Clostridia bacterium]
MIKRLRRKLIAASMLSLLLVLTVVMGTLNIFNYRSMTAQADGTLALLAEGGGSFPAAFPLTLPSVTPTNGASAEPAEPAKPGEPTAGDAAEPADPPKHTKRRFSVELPFMSRYFSVVFDADGAVIHTDTSRIAAVDETTAIEMAARVRVGAREHGFAGDYRYVRQTLEGGVRVIFLDCERERATFRTFLWGSCAVSAAGLGAVFVLIWLFSGRIVRPMSESYEKQRRFITDAGHELKTPITIIDADAELLEMEVGEDNEWLHDIRRQTARLGRLTADLIYLSKMDEERVELQMIEFPFSDVVAETAQSFAAPAVTQGKRFTVDVEPMLTLCGDEKSIRQLVSILLDNALKYSPEGGEITLTARRQGRSITLTAANTAEPLDGDHFAHLFDRFYRVDGARSGGGYGLGLSIARAVVTAHKGRITAACEGGRLIISVTLPG